MSVTATGRLACIHVQNLCLLDGSGLAKAEQLVRVALYQDFDDSFAVSIEGHGRLQYIFEVTKKPQSAIEHRGYHSQLFFAPKVWCI